jgi:nitrite reductase/ring-hydroxylating ferredoxin subunit
MEQLPLPEVKDKVFELLDGIDSIHRESLRRLVSLFKEGVLEQVVTDPAIHTLMELYDLLPEATENEPDVQDENKGIMKIPVYEVPTYMPPPPPPRSQYPHWVPVLIPGKELEVGGLKEIEVDGHWIVLCQVQENEIFALASKCEQDGTSLSTSTLNRYTLSCSNHPGCYYDVRQGTRVGTAGKIDCYPVKRAEDGRISVGIDMDFVPNLPTF